MFKKTIACGLLCAAVSGVALAHSDVMAQMYAGANLGVANNTSSSGKGTSAPGYFRGYPFGVFFGYGGLLDQDFYMAAEIFGTLGTAEITSENGLKSSYGFGVSLLPGTYLTDNTMLFGRLSLLRTNFSSVDEMTSGGQIGVGLQTALMPSFDLRMEYDFTAYNSVGGIKAPRQDLATLGLVYKFE